MAGGPSRPVPVTAFAIEIKSITEAYFSECSGLSVKMEMQDVKEGGLNYYVHRLPIRAEYSPITLKRGFSSSLELWKWFRQLALTGMIELQNIAIVWYQDVASGVEVARWNVFGAYPIKWESPDLRVGGDGVVVETVEFAHQGFDLVTPASASSSSLGR